SEGRLARTAGKAPVMEALEAEKVSREEQSAMASGTDQGRSGRSSMLRYCSEVSPLRKSPGREAKAFPSSARRVREPIPAREGTSPESAFPCSCSAVSEVRSESEAGSVPASPLSARL
uniref:Uncharacterized protein n=1 Tax=Oryza brachyantha TaxID=4533 RepID=J3N841_ORYBR